MTVEKTPPPGGRSHRAAFARGTPNHGDALVPAANGNRTHIASATTAVTLSVYL